MGRFCTINSKRLNSLIETEREKCVYFPNSINGDRDWRATPHVSKPSRICRKELSVVGVVLRSSLQESPDGLVNLLADAVARHPISPPAPRGEGRTTP